MSNQSANTVNSSGDKLKIILAVVAIIIALIGFYFFSAKPMLVRTGILLSGVVVAGVLVWFSALGQNVYSFAQDSISETKKVVWPERKAALKVTGIVFGFVLVMAIFLWGSDKVLEFLLYKVILGWKQ